MWIQNPYPRYVDIHAEVLESMKDHILEIISHTYPRRTQRAALRKLIELGPDAREWALPGLLAMIERPDFVQAELLHWTGRAFRAVYLGQAETAVKEIRARIDAYVDSDAVKPWADILSRLGKPGLEALWDIRQYDEYAIPELAAGNIAASPDAIQFLLEKYHASEEESGQALGILSMVAADESVPVLVEMLGHQNEELRIAAVFALGYTAWRSNDEAAQPHIASLIKLLGHTDPRMHWGALRALRHLGPLAASALPELMEETRGKFPALAADCIGSLESEGAPAIDMLLDILRREDQSEDTFVPPLPWEKRAERLSLDITAPYPSDKTLFSSSIQALRAIGPAAKRALPVLRAIQSGHSSEEIRRSAGFAIGSIESTPGQSPQESARENWPGELIPPEDLDPCLAGLAKLNHLDVTREEIEKTLHAFLAQPVIRDARVSMGPEPAWKGWISEQLDAISVLGAFRYKPIMPLLLEKLDEPFLQREIYMALRDIEDESAVPTLRDKLRELELTDYEVRQIAHTLSEILREDAMRSETLPALERHYFRMAGEWGPSNSFYIEGTGDYIALLADESAVDRFQAIVDDYARDFRERTAAAWILGRMPEASPQLLVHIASLLGEIHQAEQAGVESLDAYRAALDKTWNRIANPNSHKEEANEYELDEDGDVIE